MASSEAPTNATVGNRGSDFLHANSIAYNAELDQIVVSVRNTSEIWIIDHSIPTDEARGAAGDFLYRWGNPTVHGQAAHRDGLSVQHDARWIPPGFPGAGHLLVFNNDAHQTAPKYSAAVEIVPPMNDAGEYSIVDGRFGPDRAVWQCSADRAYAPFISGAQRLANGNTLMTYGPEGRFVEVTAAGEVVWEYWSPFPGEVRLTGGVLPQPMAPFHYGVFRATHVAVDHPALRGRRLRSRIAQPASGGIDPAELERFRGEPSPF